ncbi:hypothetical protein KP509_15G061000 [Ceratopteris richardii]|uniref:Nucleolar 27S pre-rRNA processing Urb2/Npa2 C-terminal domain-containing protein n=1 Tax=Ceratopteris richardii TaxID=49495 RepID=A0A8T2TA93_CERRI|nr:hypothetical protein KP509_15G061000 [Ceratopteris richardii]
MLPSIRDLPSTTSCLDQTNLSHGTWVFTAVFLSVLLDVVKLLLTDYERHFTPKLDLWVTLSRSCLRLSSVMLMHKNKLHVFGNVTKTLFQLLVYICRGFAKFLKSSTNPRKMFTHVVGKLLESLLTLQAELRIAETEGLDGSYSEEVRDLLCVIEDILKSSLFHPFHLEGYLYVCRLSRQGSGLCHDMVTKESEKEIQARKIKNDSASLLSYHRLLFQQLCHFIDEGKDSTIGSLAWILRTYIKEKKVQMSSTCHGVLGIKGKMTSRKPSQKQNAEEDQTFRLGLDSASDKGQGKQNIEKGIFEMFAELSLPVVRKFQEVYPFFLSDKSNVLQGTYPLLSAINNLLLVAIEEHVYVPTEDTPNLSHMNYMKELYNILVGFCNFLPQLFNGAFPSHWNQEASSLFATVLDQVLVGISRILELEYRVLDDDFDSIWKSILFVTTFKFTKQHAKESEIYKDAEGAINLALQVLKIFGELRQVDRPMLSLCCFMRNIIMSDQLPSMIKLQSRALTSVFLSPSFLTIFKALIEELPEGQTAALMRLLKEDMEETLKSLVMKGVLSSKKCHKMLHAATRILTEIYVCTLEYQNVKSSNSIQIEISVRALLTGTLNTFREYLVDSVLSDGDVLTSFVGFCASVLGNTAVASKHDSLTNQMSPPCTVDADTSLMNSTSILLSWEFIIRLYMSSRMLQRKCIFLMPHKQAKKTCLALNDSTISILFGELSCVEQISYSKGFFPLSLREGNITILDFVRGVNEVLKGIGQKFASLQYTLDCLVMFHISDLKKQIRAIGFLLNQMCLTNNVNEEDGELMTDQQINVSQRGERLSKADMKRLRKRCKKLKQEAFSLKSFLLEWISKIKMGEKFLKEMQCWNRVIFTLDKRTLPVARWALLCENIEIWSGFAQESDLRAFCCFMLGKTLFVDSEKDSHSSCCSFFSATSCFIQDDLFYEQELIREVFLQMLSQELLETFPLCEDLSSHSIRRLLESELSSHTQNICAKKTCHLRNQTMATAELEDNYSIAVVSDVSNLRKCIFLLELASKFPKGYLDIKSASSFMSFISKFERSFFVWFLKMRDQHHLGSYEPSSNICFELLHNVLDLFLASRRSLEALILKERTFNTASSESSLACSFVHDTSFLYWLLFSVDAITRVFNNILNQNSNMDLLASCKDKLLSYVKCTTGLLTFISQNSCREDFAPLLIACKEQGPATKDGGIHISFMALINCLLSKMDSCSNFMKQEKSNVFNYLLSKEITKNSGKKESHILKFFPFGDLALLSGMSSVLWSITHTLESLDEKCHVAKDGHMKWSGKLPDELLNWMTSVESFITDNLNNFLLADHISIKGSTCTEVLKSVFGSPPRADEVTVIQEEESFVSYDSDIMESNDICEVGNDSARNKRATESLSQCSPNVMTKESYESAQAPGDFLKMQDSQILMFHEMLSGRMETVAWILGELYITIAAIVKLKGLFHSPNVINSAGRLASQEWTPAMQLHVGAANRILQELVVAPHLEVSSTLKLLSGVIKYIESIGTFLPYARPTLSSTAFVDLIYIQLILHGAFLSQSQTVKLLQSCEELKGPLRNCFKMFVKKPLGLHYHLTLQTIEQSLLCVQGRQRREDFGLKVQLDSAQLDSFLLLGGIECLSVLLEAVSGTKRLQILSRYSSRYVAAIFSLIGKCQLWCHQTKDSRHPLGSTKFSDTLRNNNFSFCNFGILPLKCLEILIIFFSREVIFPMKANQVAQAISCPSDLFRHFYQRNMQKEKLMQNIFSSNEFPGFENYSVLVPDDPLMPEIYIACCKLLRSLLRHRSRECGHFMALLGESLRALLFFLEVMEIFIGGGQSFSHLNRQSLLQCAGWLRRVYEEVGEHRSMLRFYITHMLSDYICIISGYGMSTKGLSREVEAILRPGVYALVDVCSADDIQQLHAVLGEGPRRTSLTTLRQDYEQHFKYTGKV